MLFTMHCLKWRHIVDERGWSNPQHSLIHATINVIESFSSTLVSSPSHIGVRVTQLSLYLPKGNQYHLLVSLALSGLILVVVVLDDNHHRHSRCNPLKGDFYRLGNLYQSLNVMPLVVQMIK